MGNKRPLPFTVKSNSMSNIPFTVGKRATIHEAAALLQKHERLTRQNCSIWHKGKRVL